MQIVEFSDYIQPNAALAAGDLDGNSYQHKPFLDQQVKDRGYKIVNVGYTVNFPDWPVFQKGQEPGRVERGARFGIPNDPTNGGRVLLVLQDKGLIKLRPEAGLKATPLDVIDNPKKLRFVELDAAQLPRSLDDLDASAVNTNYALSAGLNPAKDAIAQEAAKSPYVNLLAVREQDKDKPWVAKLVKAYHSEEIRKFIQTEFKGSVLAGF
ncbi:MetQ/NlpA family ABC transporter substrate-binding protein [Polaromonas sp. P1(28)-8]|nr:MetQ/NlpA family ABC transporter substrate-binding protein [Polaromonas sp. P1(28)-8]